MPSGKIIRIIEWFNRQNLILILFIVSCANFLSCGLDGGEEQYLAFAKQYMDHSWMPHSFTLNHPPGGNLIFQVIAGFMLRYLTFEQTAVIGRLICFLMLVTPISFIIKRFKINNLTAVFIIQAFFFPHQSIWMGEWVFKGFEEKTVAYIFVYWAIYFLITDKPFLSIIFSAIATYFHFLAGGWMSLFIVVYYLFYNRKLIPVLYLSGLYLIFILPLFIYLYKIYVINNPPIIKNVFISEIYAYYRLKHHIGAFGDTNYFIKHHLGGMLLSALCYMACMFWHNRYGNPWIKKLNLLNIVIFSQQFVFILVAIFDTHATLMKTYPFRTSTLSSLLFLLEVTLIIQHYGLPAFFRIYLKHYKNKRKAIFLNNLNYATGTVFLILFIIETTQTILSYNKYSDALSADLLSLIEYAGKETPREAVFIFPDSDYPYSFTRRSNRERFVVEKFIPTHNDKIYEWYNRLHCKKRIKEDIRVIDSVKNIYRIDYLITDSTYNYRSLKNVRLFGKYKLYRLE
jgi:hypothetical protein